MVSSLAPAKTLLDYAIEYSQRGYSVIPLAYGTKDKHYLKWEEYQRRKPTDNEINTWFGNGQVKNIAIVCGQVSGGLVVTEFDVLDNYESFQSLVEKKLGLVLQDTTPVVKTARGYHVYWLVKTPVKSAKFANMEIRSDGNYVLAPPSKHPSGKLYELVNPEVKSPFTIDSLLDIGIDLNQKPASPPDSQPTWVREALQHGKSEGLRNDTCFKLAGYFKNHLPQDVTETLLLNWNSKNTPPLSQKEVITAIESAYRYPIADSIFNNTTYKPINSPSENGFSYEKQQATQQVGDKCATSYGREYGDLATPFDKFLKENPEPHWKRDVAEIIGTTYKDRSFQALIRRRADDHQIRILHGGDKIQWVNKDWRSNLISLDAGKRTQLGLKLPFGMEKYVGCSERSQIVVAGDIGSGKTHYGYLFAELNIGKIPIRHFVNEMGDSKAIRNLEDFSLLREHYGQDYFLISQDRDNLDVTENLDPDGLNIYDYLRMSDNKEWYLSLQKTLATLSAKLDKGIMVVMIQKKQGQVLGYGGEGTRMQAETYLSLNVVKNVVGDDTKAGYKLGRIDILKCKEWADGSRINPEGLSFEYKTAPKHGKLLPESLSWAVMEKN